MATQYALVEQDQAEKLLLLAGCGQRRFSDEIAFVLHGDRPDQPGIERRNCFVHVLTVEIHPGFEAQRIAGAEAAGGDAGGVRRSAGQSKYEPITLERGVTHDLEFEQWANKVWNYGSGLGMEVSLKDFRKDVIIELYNEAGQLVIAYKVYRCWVSEYTAMPELDASANAVAIQSMTLQNEGWERDYDVTEPTEPMFVEPQG